MVKHHSKKNKEVKEWKDSNKIDFLKKIPLEMREKMMEIF